MKRSGLRRWVVTSGTGSPSESRTRLLGVRRSRAQALVSCRRSSRLFVGEVVDDTHETALTRASATSTTTAGTQELVRAAAQEATSATAPPSPMAGYGRNGKR